MATFVLVHGAFAGGWQMSGVAALLRQAGHIVVTPTLTGLAERADRLSPEVELGTHVRDVVVLLEDEGLNDMALLGKSYSGLVVTAAAEQIPASLRHLVYLDALVPENGQSMLDVFGPEHADVIRRVVRERGDGWRLPVDGAVATRLSDHPFRTFTEAVEVTNPRAVAIPRTYIHCTGARRRVTPRSPRRWGCGRNRSGGDTRIWRPGTTQSATNRKRLPRSWDRLLSGDYGFGVP